MTHIAHPPHSHGPHVNSVHADTQRASDASMGHDAQRTK